MFKEYSKLLSEYAPSLIFGVILLYWEGYLFLITYLQQFSISVNLSDFSFQDILLMGVNPIFMVLLWISKYLIIFDVVKKWFLTSSIKALTLDFLVFTITIFLIILLYKLILHIYRKKENKYLNFIKKIANYRIFKIFTMISLSIFTLYWLPRWSAIEAKVLGPQIITQPYSVIVFYDAPALVPQDTCDNSKKCFGNYIKILDGKDYVYLDPGDKCREQKEIGYNYDSGPNGEKIITNSIIEETQICNSIAVPKQRISEVINLYK